MDGLSLLNEEMVCLDGSAADNMAAMQQLGKVMVEHGYITPAYIESVKEREKNFPTGIGLLGLGVAIPHATPEENVLRDGIAVLRLAKPIPFQSMENPEDTILANMVFLLALKNSKQHLTMLQKLFGVFQKDEIMQKLQTTKDAGIFCEMLGENLK